MCVKDFVLQNAGGKKRGLEVDLNQGEFTKAGKKGPSPEPVEPDNFGGLGRIELI